MQLPKHKQSAITLTHLVHAVDRWRLVFSQWLFYKWWHVADLTQALIIHVTFRKIWTVAGQWVKCLIPEKRIFAEAVWNCCNCLVTNCSISFFFLPWIIFFREILNDSPALQPCPDIYQSRPLKTEDVPPGCWQQAGKIKTLVLWPPFHMEKPVRFSWNVLNVSL